MFKCSLWIILGLLAFSCGKNAHEKKVQEGDSRVLATVNGSAITRYDLNVGLKSGIGKYVGEKPSKDVRRKVLESLVQSRLLSKVQEKKLSQKESIQLDKLVEAYREKLLVQMYLNKSAFFTAVTDEQIAQFYGEHPDQFGASVKVKYELLTTQRELAVSERNTVLQQLSDASKISDWRTWAKQDVVKSLSVNYRRGVSTSKNLNKKLRQIAAVLKEGEVSDIAIIENRAYLLRAISVERTSPEPLIQVKPRIRALLEAMQLKTALERAVKSEMKTAKITFL